MTPHTEQPTAPAGGVDVLYDAIRELGWGEIKPPFVPPVAVPVEHRDAVYAKRATSWCARSLEGKASDLAAMAPDTGRNNALNAAGLQLYRYVLAGYLDGEHVTEALREAALTCGLSNGEIEATLQSAQRGAEKYGPQEPPIDPPAPPVDESDPFSGPSVPAGVNAETGEVVDGGGEVPPTVPVDADAFWESRDVLRHVRDFARGRLCSPWSVLGVVLARVITATPHFVVLPDLVGSHASLNLFVALVGPSGGGKGASESAAADCIDIRDVEGEELETATVGSGEGIGHLYAHREKGVVVRDRYSVLFTVPEVDNLVALAGRQGATLLPQLRSAWSGEKLGFAYADKHKALPINRHDYRMGLVLGVQPGRAAPLLDDADGGTPQRFLWLPTSDPGAPDETPPVPPVRSWSIAGRPWAKDVFASGLVVLPIPDIARQTIGRNRLSRLRERGEALDGHALLTRLKTAAALALLDERRAVSEDDWALAGVIMAVSDATRESVVSYLSSKARQANTAKGEAEGHRAVVVAERIAEASSKRVARKIMARLRAADQALGLAMSEVRTAVAARDRQFFDEAVERLSEAGQVVVERSEKGQRIKLAE